MAEAAAELEALLDAATLGGQALDPRSGGPPFDEQEPPPGNEEAAHLREDGPDAGLREAPAQVEGEGLIEPLVGQLRAPGVFTEERARPRAAREVDQGGVGIEAHVVTPDKEVGQEAGPAGHVQGARGGIELPAHDCTHGPQVVLHESQAQHL